MTTLVSILRLLAMQVGETYSGTATGGSTTTLVDSSLSLPDDYLNGGFIIYLSGNNANKSALITDYTSSTGTITFGTQTGACAAADLYIACHKNFNRTILVNAVNLALQAVGRYPAINTALTPTTGTVSYALPSGVFNVKRVQNGESGSEQENYWWEEHNGYIYFRDGYEPETGDTVKLFYIGNHASVSLDADVVNDLVPIDTLVKVAAVEALSTRYGVVGDDDPRLKAKLSAALAAKQDALRHYRTPVIVRPVQLTGLGG